MPDPIDKNPFPDPPDAKDSRFPRNLPPVAWWILAFVMVGVAIFWLPSQCVSNITDSSIEEDGATPQLPELNQDKDLEFREDGLWYQVGSQETFSGVAVDYHEDNVTVRSKTKLRDGKAYGLIEEWDENGTLKGQLFKDEFLR